MKKLLYPRAWVIALLIVTTIALLTYSLGRAEAIPAVQYFSYLYSTCTLVVTVLSLPRAWRFLVRAVKGSRVYRLLMRWLMSVPFLRRWMEDPHFRTWFALLLSDCANAAFIFINLYSGITRRSAWFVSLAIYYFLLTLARTYLVIRAAGETMTKDAYAVYRMTGVLLLLLNLFLSVMLSVMIRDQITKEMPFYLAIVNAAYTFFLMALAIAGVIRFRKYHSPLLSAVKAVGLFAALVSVLLLQTSMISTFGGDLHFLAVMTGSIGLVVEIVALPISVYMIVSATRRIREEERGG